MVSAKGIGCWAFHICICVRYICRYTCMCTYMIIYVHMYFLPIWSKYDPIWSHIHMFHKHTQTSSFLHVLPASALLPLGPSLHSVSPGLQWRDIRQWPRLRPPLRCRPWTWKSAQKGWFHWGNPRTKWKFLAGKICKNHLKIICE